MMYHFSVFCYSNVILQYYLTALLQQQSASATVSYNVKLCVSWNMCRVCARVSVFTQVYSCASIRMYAHESNVHI